MKKRPLKPEMAAVTRMGQPCRSPTKKMDRHDSRRIGPAAVTWQHH